VKYFLNFHEQMKPLFMVQGNPSSNAKIIGSISNIHSIYNAIRQAEAEAKGVNRKLNCAEGDIEDLTTAIELHEAEYVKRDVLINGYRNIWEDMKGLSDRIEKISMLKDRIARRVKVRNRLTDKLDALLVIPQMSDDLIKVDLIIKEKRRLQKARKRQESLESLISILSEFDFQRSMSSDLDVKVAQIASGRAKTALMKQERLLTGLAEVESDLLEKEDFIDRNFQTCDVCGSEKKHWKILNGEQDE